MTIVYSFDVFDTLISRSVAEPVDIFVQAAIEVSKSKIIHMSPEVYANERYQAEKRLLAQGKYAPLSEIFLELKREINICGLLVNLLLEKELELECAGFWPIKKNVQKVKHRRDGGSPIIFISDTYFSSVFIKDVLCDFGIANRDEKVFVSCEFNAGKRHGKLFSMVAKEIGVSSGEIVHFGDNHTADVKGAKSVGVKGIPVSGTHLNKYEKVIKNFATSWPVSTRTRIYLSKLASNLRRVRLQNDTEKRVLFDVAVGVAGPLLFSFVRNLLRWSEVKGIDRLYFLSRDGHIMLKIAKMMVSGQSKKTPELRYLYVSRAISLLSSLHNEANAEQLNSLASALRPCSLQDFIIFIAGSNSNLISYYNRRLLGKSISNIKNHKIIEPLLQNPMLYQEVLAYNKNRKKLFREYLAQEFNSFEDSKVALVDVGWRLTMHDLIAKILVDLGIAPPKGFYIGIDNVRTDCHAGSKDAFMWDRRERPNWLGIEGVTRIIEVFCTADQGRVIEYERLDLKVFPVLSCYDTEFYKNWGLPEVQLGILRAVESMMDLDFEEDFHLWEPLLLRELLFQFWCKPGVKEVRDWGAYPFEISQTSNDQIVPLWLKSRFMVKAAYLLWHDSWRGSKTNSWPAANELMTISPVRVMLNFAQKSKKLVKSSYGKW